MGIIVEKEKAQEVLELLWNIDRGYEPSEGERTYLESIMCMLCPEGTEKIPESIVRLKNLQGFRLNGSCVKEWPMAVCGISSLTSLQVTNTSISVIPEEIGRLKNLKKLDLHSFSWKEGKESKIRELPEEVWNLTNLENLNLSETQIQELPKELGKLINLKELNLNGTQIQELPKELGNLSNLEELDLSDIQIRELSKEIWNLTNLEELYLARTQIRELPKELGNLSNLESLDLRRTQIKELPKELGNLTNLKVLDLSDIQIQELPKELGNLTNLKILGLNDIQIRELPKELGNLTNLEELDLSDMQISELPREIENLTGLRKLYLQNFSTFKIPGELLRLNLPFDINKDYADSLIDENNGIYLKDAAISTQPLSLFAQPRELIQAYYDAPKVMLREAKVIFLGDGDVGKTYTIKRILNHGKRDTYDTSATPGIHITSYSRQYQDKVLDIRFWDFGGQEIMHAMHRCFLTGRTCYVVVVDNRKGQMNEQAEYWLRNIDSFAGGCPVILAVNRIDGLGDNGIDEPRLKAMYPNLVGDPIYYSAKSSTEEEFQKLTDAICLQASRLDSYGMEFPENWAAIRNELMNMNAQGQGTKRYYIDKEEFYRICEEHGEKNRDICKWLLEWFNDLGICFSYHLDGEKKELPHYQILNPQWLTNAIYVMINACQNFSKKGVISHAAIDTQLNNPSVEQVKRVFPEFVSYTPEEREYILQIMRKFQLSYQVSEDEEFIPALCLNQTPEGLEPKGFVKRLSYEMVYTYLPDTVIHRLMIQCYQYLNPKKIWLKGLYIELPVEDVAAVVRMADSTRLQMDVYAMGDGRPLWKTLNYLRRHILQINRDLNMEAEDVILVRDGNREGRIDVEYLLNLKKDGYQEYSIQGSDKKPLKINIPELLGEVYGSETLRLAQEQALDRHIAYEEALQMIIRKMDSITEELAVQGTQLYHTMEGVKEQLVTANDGIGQIVEHLELVQNLMETFSTHQDTRVRQLGEEMRQALNEKKSPWQKLRDFLGDSANVVTIASVIGPYVMQLLQIPEMQQLPQNTVVFLQALTNMMK